CQAEEGIRDRNVTGVQTCALPIFRRLVLFSLIVMIVIGSMATYHIKQRSLYAEKAEQYEQLEEQMTALKKQENQLKEEIKLLNNDEYILDIARTNYFFSKEGE